MANSCFWPHNYRFSVDGNYKIDIKIKIGLQRKIWNNFKLLLNYADNIG